MKIKKAIEKMIPDGIFLGIKYKNKMGVKLNLRNPQTFNEKLQWLKLHDRNPQYTKMVDKYAAKELASKVIGEEHIIPTLGVWDKFDDIDFDKLPDQFVLKCTHDSGGVIVCRDKTKFNIKSAKEKLEKSLNINYYYAGREWPYKHVKPRIIAEKYMENSDGTSVSDFKFYCFFGKADYVMICTDRDIGKTKFYYIDKFGKIDKRMSFDGMNLKDENKVKIPDNLEEMFSIAEKLSQGFRFLRIDLYCVDGIVYFGEYTFFPTSGFDNDRTKYAQKYLNNKLDLRRKI